MGSRLVFAHMPFLLWCWPSSIDKDSSLGGEIIADGWECLKHQQCIQCSPSLYTKEDQTLSTEPFLACVDLSTGSCYHAWERYWGYVCQGLVWKGEWTRLHQHWLDTLLASTRATISLHALCMPSDTCSRIFWRETTAHLACSTNLPEETRSQTFWKEIHGITPIF